MTESSINDLRISITSKCNLNCIYCHREGHKECFTSVREMTVEEISKIVDLSGIYGVNSVKITGGEPLVRPDILEITKVIGSKPFIEDLSVVTNGILLKNYVKGLKETGVHRINISLDTLDPEMYKSLSRGNIKLVLEGLKAATSLSFSLLKINMLMLKGINEEKLDEMLVYAKDLSATTPTPIHLQLIELVQTPSISNEFFNKHFIDIRREIKPKLLKSAESTYFRIKNKRECFVMPGNFVVELVTPTHNSAFCENCQRLRVTADGYLKPCLMREDNLIDIVGPMRNGTSQDELKKIFSEAISRKTPYWKFH